MSLEQVLKELQERDLEVLDGAKYKIGERYASLPLTVEKVAELLDMPSEQCVQACVSAAWHYKDLKWYDVMEIVRSFHVVKKRLEEEGK
jgi:hypothetical protein